ncbi:hypothetical protein [Bradyrhizobium sp. SEMIA]|uniref:hypothetical protein n=1 Tax=Bradyrhizobium sp. SEMIA TaxID=2597515 RepID=UPI0018A49958|nr:hypothetical protein [Bradyrhizobium sp. SEMIA]QOG20563.1 hypothetical protein FOM02_27625 [Bradyrhizobium sp. SEMIA]
MVKRIERVDLLDMNAAVLDRLNLGSELERPAGGGFWGRIRVHCLPHGEQLKITKNHML